jgi:hypothetical protein
MLAQIMIPKYFESSVNYVDGKSYLQCVNYFVCSLSFSVIDVLPGMPASKDKVKNNVTRVFEDWWKKGLPNKEGLVMSSFVYIVERSLDLRPKPLVIYFIVYYIELDSLLSLKIKDVKIFTLPM